MLCLLLLLISVVHTGATTFSPVVVSEYVTFEQCPENSVYRVYIERPNEEVIRAVEISRAEIVGGLYQHYLNGNTAPHWSAPFVNQSVKCDSFVTFSVTERKGNDFDCTATSPDFKLSGSVFKGSYYCSRPDDSQLQSSRVLIMQLSFEQGAYAHIEAVIYTRRAQRCAVQLGLGNSTATITSPCVMLPDLNITFPELPVVISGPSDYGWIVGVIFGFVGLLLIVLVVVYVRRRRDKTMQKAHLAENFINADVELDRVRREEEAAAATKVGQAIGGSSSSSAFSARPAEGGNMTDTADELEYSDFL